MNVPVITELTCEENVQYLPNNCDNGFDIEFYRQQSFASGQVFTTSSIDSLMSTAYFNSDILALIKTLISGGLNTKLESILSEGTSLKTSALNTETSRNRDRYRVTQISLSGPFSHYSEAKYGELFLEALKSYGILCFGIYRLLETNQLNATPNMRYVMTNPPAHLQLNPTDLVFINIHV